MNLGIGLANKGHKVLLIDNDPQGSLSICMGYKDPDSLELTIVDVIEKIVNEEDIPEGFAIMHHSENVDLLPSNMRFTKGNHAFVVSTHTDKAHVHNHIIFNSTALSGDRKFKDYLLSGMALGRLSNLICMENGLSVMKLEDICNLPVKEIAADDSILFIWATFPNLKEALEVIDAWGFEYKTVAFVWVKQNKKSDSLFWGMGYWTRSNAEVCLLATKGRPKRVDSSVHQVIISHIEEHSKKPAETRDRIVKLVGDVPRVELFARQKTPGWNTWGNELENDLELAA